MRIKLDENLPFRLVPFLRRLGHEVDTPHDERLVGHTDQELWSAAQSDSRFLITQDLDFSDVRKFAPGSHCGILLLRLRSPTRQNLIDRITELFSNEDVGNWPRCFLVATERKLRILKAKRDGETTPPL